MAPRLTLRPDLEVWAARTFLGPQVARIRDDAADAAARYAPDAKTWGTARDERVRPTHVDADFQTIPANLRYRVGRPGGVGEELARVPRDPDLSAANRINCRCDSAGVPQAIARTVHGTDVVVVGTTARAEVVAVFHRVVESEYPEAPDSGGGWMRRALVETATLTRSRLGTR